MALRAKITGGKIKTTTQTLFPATSENTLKILKELYEP